MNVLRSRANIGEMLAVGRAILNLIKENPIADDAYLDSQVKHIEQKVAALAEENNSGALVNNMDDADLVRDLDTRSIFYEVKAKCVRRESDKQQKAEEIYKLLDRYGIGMINESYKQQSASVISLIKDLEAPELSPAIAAIPDLAELITNLKQSQAAFEVAETEYINNYNKDENSVPAYVLSRQLEDIINKEFYIYLKAMTAVNAEKYSKLMSKLKSLFKKTNQEIKERLDAIKRKKEAEEAATA